MTVTEYRDEEPLRDARARYFADNGFGDDGGYGARFAKIELGPIPIWIPNTAARVKALHYHDLHHVVTGYATDLAGEAEIGAWEIASGCRDKLVAWFLNMQAMTIGMFITPRRVFAAFVRGRHSDNLYPLTYHDALLDETVADMRERLRLAGDAPSATPRERRAFLGWATLSAIVALLSVGVVIGGVVACGVWVAGRLGG